MRKMNRNSKMRRETSMLLVVMTSLLCSRCSSWTLGPVHQQTTTTHRRQRPSARGGFPFSSKTALQSLATPPAENTSLRLDNSSSSSGGGEVEVVPKHHGNIQEELQSGRTLEGGKVIDFSSVKASGQAEQALAQAREALLGKDDGANAQEKILAMQGGTILGINEDVIKEVGHDLGTFSTPAEVQDCAAQLRSKAPSGLFEKYVGSSNSEEEGRSYTAEDQRQLKSLLDKAYFESGEVTSAFAKTFYMGTMLLPPAAREAIWAVYVWCRRTDEIVDAPRESDDEMLEDLSLWELRLENLWKYGHVVDVFDLCLLDIRIKYPNLDITPFRDMIRGMLMDVPTLGQDRYNEFDELHLYCYRVAGTVGLMSLPIFGCASGYNDEIAREPALSLGVAFQLTNILRDVGEDAVQRGRVYLPQEDLKKFDVTEDQIFEQKVDENYVNLMKYEIARARMYYDRARRGVFMLAPESRLPVQSSLDAYGRILDKIEENGYDSLTRRAYVDKWEKLSIIPFSWYRTLDISRWLPLPGDKKVESLTEL